MRTTAEPTELVVGGKARIPLADAWNLAIEAVDMFSPVSHRVEIAGSIRRRKAEVGDVEICLIPKTEKRLDEASLFGDEEIDVNVQYELASKLRDQGVLTDRLDKNGHACFGSKFQRVVFKGFALDIFSAQPEQWGVTLAIRTGNAEFSRRLVTPKAQGGFMLAGQMARDWRIIDRGLPLDTPEEKDVFAALELPWVDPWGRDL